MTYPDGDTVTSVTGTVEAEGSGARLTWNEQEYVRRGRRSVDFGGNYSATIRGDTMDDAWYQRGRRVVPFTMTASSTSPATALLGQN